MSIRNATLAAIVFIIIYNILFFQTGLGIGTALFFLILNIFFFINRDKGNPNFMQGIFYSSAAIVFALLFAFRSNWIVQAINLSAAVFFSLASLYFYKFQGNLNFKIPFFLILPITIIDKSIQGFFSIFKQGNVSPEPTKKDHTTSLIRGLLITVPVLTALLLLLVRADPVFGKLTENFLKNIGERTIISLILFIILLGLALAKFTEKFLEQKVPGEVSAGKAHELGIISGSIIALFAVFIIVQVQYLFSTVGERQLHQLGITSLTYSEYVRKGFFELLVVSSIAAGVVVYIFKYLHRLKGRQKLLIQSFCAVLTFETGLILLSAAKRVFLYADSHGLTRARIFGFIFLAWLALILVIFLLHIYKEMKKEWFFASTLASVIFAFVVINIINIDGLIATKLKPTVNEEIDYFYITSLSTDASDAWKDAIADSENIISSLEQKETLTTEDNRKLYWTKKTLEQLYMHTGYLVDKYGDYGQILSWHKKDQYPMDRLKQQRKLQSLNFSEYFTYKTTGQNLAYFQQIPVLLYRISQLEQKVTDKIRRNTPLDRSTKPPLL